MPFGEVAYEIAWDTYEEYRKDHSDADVWDGTRDGPAASPTVTVPSPKRTYTLLHRLAAGDVADVYRAEAPSDAGGCRPVAVYR